MLLVIKSLIEHCSKTFNWDDCLQRDCFSLRMSFLKNSCVSYMFTFNLYNDLGLLRSFPFLFLKQRIVTKGRYFCSHSESQGVDTTDTTKKITTHHRGWFPQSGHRNQWVFKKGVHDRITGPWRCCQVPTKTTTNMKPLGVEGSNRMVRAGLPLIIPIGSMGLVYLPTFGWFFVVNVSV